MRAHLEVKVWGSGTRPDVVRVAQALLPPGAYVKVSGGGQTFIQAYYDAPDEVTAARIARRLDEGIPYSHSRIGVIKLQEAPGESWHVATTGNFRVLA